MSIGGTMEFFLYEIVFLLRPAASDWIKALTVLFEIRFVLLLSNLPCMTRIKTISSLYDNITVHWIFLALP